jgi:hypothetical protein
VQVVQDSLDVVKLLFLQSCISFFIKAQILKPEWRIARILFNTLVAELQRLKNTPLSLLIATSLQVDRPISVLLAEFLKQCPGFGTLANATLKLGAFDLNSPLVTGDKELSNLSILLIFLVYFYALDYKILVLNAVVKSLLKQLFAFSYFTRFLTKF